jgi:putative zinc finger/helix-turn-helix YgiT family protein
MTNLAKRLDALPLCPVCRRGRLHPTTRMGEFNPRGKKVEVELLTSRCDACGEHTTRAAQHSENLVRLAARKQQYGPLLMGEEILGLRKRYGLNQQAAAKIFGKGKIAFSRYENEASYPDDSTTLLLRLAIDKPDVIKALADWAGIDLPLWADRCEDDPRLRTRQPPSAGSTRLRDNAGAPILESGR